MIECYLEDDAPIKGNTMKAVKKTIADLVLKGDNAYTVKDLAMRIYEIDLDEIERRHTIPVVRAMKQLVDEYPQLDIYRGDCGDGKGRPMIILDETSPMAHAMQRAKHGCYWYNRLYHNGKVLPEATEAALFKRVDKKELKKGGNFYRFAKSAKAELSGDADAIAECEKEQADALASIGAKLRGATACVTEGQAAQAMELIYTYAQTLDDPDEEISLEHEGKQLVFSIRDLPKSAIAE